MASTAEDGRPVVPDEEPYPRFTSEEFERRHAATRKLMESNGCDALVLFGTSSGNGTGQADIYYLSHHMGRQENILLFFRDQEPVLLVESYNHVPNALRQSAIADTRYGGPKSQFAQTIARLLRERGVRPKRLGVIGWMPYQVYNPLFADLPDCEPVDLTGDFRLLRLRKSEEEIQWLTRGAERTDAALLSMVQGMHAGMREHELGALLVDGYRELGGEDYLHYISSTPQDESARCVPAQTPSRRSLMRGDVVVMELSIGYYGYAGQALRSIILDASPNPLYADLYAVAEAAYDAMCAALKPGATTDDVLSTAGLIDERGYEIIDGLLHGYGVGVLPPSVPGDGDPSTMSRPVRLREETAEPFVFEKDMTVVVQPNVVTKDCRAGVQLGNLLVISEDGAQALHRCPMEFMRAGGV